MASGGLACLDDFDAFREEERRPLHEALETQRLSISKASVTETLTTETSVLAAANPKYGRFDQYEPIGEQIDLEPGLISRFDLIFTITDQPDPDNDDELAEHILENNQAGEIQTAEKHGSNPGESQEFGADTDEFSPPISSTLLRKYTTYARRNCFPVLTEEAKDVIKEFYVDLRAKGMDEDAPTPVTARKLEAIIRLSEASARIRLSETVEKEDAERVIQVVQSCLQDIGVDPETGEFDSDVIETGTAKESQEASEQIKQIVEEIDENSDSAGAPLEDILKLAEKHGYSQAKVKDMIHQLRRKGDAYSPSEDEFKIV
jgi:replicative DNA helicase Mcm